MAWLAEELYGDLSNSNSNRIESTSFFPLPANILLREQFDNSKTRKRQSISRYFQSSVLYQDTTNLPTYLPTYDCYQLLLSFLDQFTQPFIIQYIRPPRDLGTSRLTGMKFLILDVFSKVIDDCDKREVSNFVVSITHQEKENIPVVLYQFQIPIQEIRISSVFSWSHRKPFGI